MSVDLTAQQLREKLMASFDRLGGPECTANEATFVSSLITILLEQREALKYECGNRCAYQNPCNAREALADTDQRLKSMGVL